MATHGSRSTLTSDEFSKSGSDETRASDRRTICSSFFEDDAPGDDMVLCTGSSFGSRKLLVNDSTCVQDKCVVFTPSSFLNT